MSQSIGEQQIEVTLSKSFEHKTISAQCQGKMFLVPLPRQKHDFLQIVSWIQFAPQFLLCLSVVSGLKKQIPFKHLRHLQEITWRYFEVTITINFALLSGKILCAIDPIQYLFFLNYEELVSTFKLSIDKVTQIHIFNKIIRIYSKCFNSPFLTQSQRETFSKLILFYQKLHSFQQSTFHPSQVSTILPKVKQNTETNCQTNVPISLETKNQLNVNYFSNKNEHKNKNKKYEKYQKHLKNESYNKKQSIQNCKQIKVESEGLRDKNIEIKQTNKSQRYKKKQHVIDHRIALGLYGDSSEGWRARSNPDLKEAVHKQKNTQFLKQPYQSLVFQANQSNQMVQKQSKVQTNSGIKRLFSYPEDGTKFEFQYGKQYNLEVNKLFWIKFGKGKATTIQRNGKGYLRNQKIQIDENKNGIIGDGFTLSLQKGVLCNLQDGGIPFNNPDFNQFLLDNNQFFRLTSLSIYGL